MAAPLFGRSPAGGTSPAMPRPRLLALVTAVLSAAVMAAPVQAGAQVPATVGSARLVASFGHQVTGVTVSATGRVFVGFEMSRDGRTLFWRAVKGDTLYAAPTAALADPGLTSRRLSRRVRRI